MCLFDFPGPYLPCPGPEHLGAGRVGVPGWLAGSMTGSPSHAKRLQSKARPRLLPTILSGRSNRGQDRPPASASTWPVHACPYPSAGKPASLPCILWALTRSGLARGCTETFIWGCAVTVPFCICSQTKTDPSGQRARQYRGPSLYHRGCWFQRPLK